MDDQQEMTTVELMQDARLHVQLAAWAVVEATARSVVAVCAHVGGFAFRVMVGARERQGL